MHGQARPTWDSIHDNHDSRRTVALLFSIRICLDFTANKYYVILFSLFEALFTIFTLFVLANRPLFTATKQCKSVQKHLSTKLEIKSKQILKVYQIQVKDKRGVCGNIPFLLRTIAQAGRYIDTPAIAFCHLHQCSTPPYDKFIDPEISGNIELGIERPFIRLVKDFPIR